MAYNPFNTFFGDVPDIFVYIWISSNEGHGITEKGMYSTLTAFATQEGPFLLIEA
jgi:hypothetical protein